MPLTITTLCDNAVAIPGVIAEWGFSALIEFDGLTVLMDTGPGISAAQNAASLGLDLRRVDRIVLSHGHDDHTGGLLAVLRQVMKKVEIIAHPDIWAERYARRRDGADVYTGMPFQRQALEGSGASFSLCREPVRITDSVLTSGEIPEVTGYEQIEPGRFWVKEGGELKPDLLADDLALVINTRTGLVVITGCGHHGLINTLLRAQKLTSRKEIRLVIGGCHLMGASEERLWMTMAALKEMPVERIGVSHCTGLPAAAVMARELGDRFFYNNAGARIELE